MTTGIGMKAEVAIAETGTEIEGVVTLLFRNEGTGDLDLHVASLIEPREKKIRKGSV